jgi:hypothetical protein
MMSKKLFLSFLSLVVAVALTETLAIAQARPENDPRFEKLAKELYPKAKQEGALVVYTVWDVDHIRLLLDGFSKRFPGIKTFLLAGDEIRGHDPDTDRIPGESGERRRDPYRSAARAARCRRIGGL